MYKINSNYIYIEMIHINEILIKKRYVRISDIALRDVYQRALGAFFYETRSGFPFGEMVRFSLSSFMRLLDNEKEV